MENFVSEKEENPRGAGRWKEKKGPEESQERSEEYNERGRRGQFKCRALYCRQRGVLRAD